MSEQQRYREAGVDIAAAEAGLEKIIATITGTWPKPGEFGAPALGIGYFANVIDIGGGTGLAICTDGVGTKSVIADMLNKYDTIGIDCVAMNVNDLICVGARPLSMVDYIAVGRADATMLGAIAAGLAEGARQAGISISGGEIAQLRDVVTGFDLVGMAVGLVPLDRILLGRDLEPGDQVIGIAKRHSRQRAEPRAPRLVRVRRVRHRPRISGVGCAAGRGIVAPDSDLCAGGARDSRRGARRQGAGQHHRRRVFEPAAGRRPGRLCARQPAAPARDLRVDPAVWRDRRARNVRGL